MHIANLRIQLFPQLSKRLYNDPEDNIHADHIHKDEYQNVEQVPRVVLHLVPILVRLPNQDVSHGTRRPGALDDQSLPRRR